MKYDESGAYNWAAGSAVREVLFEGLDARFYTASAIGVRCASTCVGCLNMSPTRDRVAADRGQDPRSELGRGVGRAPNPDTMLMPHVVALLEEKS